MTTLGFYGDEYGVGVGKCVCFVDFDGKFGFQGLSVVVSWVHCGILSLL